MGDTMVGWHYNWLALRLVGTTAGWHYGWLALQLVGTMAGWHYGWLALQQIERGIIFCSAVNQEVAGGN